MTQEQRPSNLLSRLGAKAEQVHNEVRGNATTYGFVNLPPGISGGVAELKECKIREHESGDLKGELYAYFVGIALTPDFHRGVKVRGQRVTLMVSLCDTPKRKIKDPTAPSGERPRMFRDNYADFLNELRRFGKETKGLAFGQIEAVCFALEKAHPCFHFSTKGWTPKATAQNPSPSEMVFTQFDGKCERPVIAADPGSHTRDRSSEGPSSGGMMQQPPPAPPPPVAPPTQVQGNGEVPPNPPQAPPAADGFYEFQEPPQGEDLDELARKAREKNETAQKDLERVALAAGVTQEEFDRAPTWSQCVSMIRLRREEKRMAAESESQEGEDSFEPQLTYTYLYRSPDPQTGKASKKATQHTVTDIDARAKTVTLKSLDGKETIHSGVSWEDLETVSA
jgi:hypothetical protein